MLSFFADKNLVFETLFDTNTAVTPIPISRVNDDGTIIKETIASTDGYTKNLLHVDAVVVMRPIGKWGSRQILRGRIRNRPP